MAATIDELLNALQNPNTGSLPNNENTWERIGNKDTFSELGLSSSKLEEFLKELIEANPYNNI